MNEKAALKRLARLQTLNAKHRAQTVEAFQMMNRSRGIIRWFLRRRWLRLNARSLSTQAQLVSARRYARRHDLIRKQGTK